MLKPHRPASRVLSPSASLAVHADILWMVYFFTAEGRGRALGSFTCSYWRVSCLSSSFCCTTSTSRRKVEGSDSWTLFSSLHSTFGLVPVMLILFSPFSVFHHTPWARLLAVLIFLLHFLTSAAKLPFPLFCLLGSLCSASACSPRFCVTRTVCDFTQLAVVRLFNLLVGTQSLQHLLPPPQSHDRALFTPPGFLY